MDPSTRASAGPMVSPVARTISSKSPSTAAAGFTRDSAPTTSTRALAMMKALAPGHAATSRPSIVVASGALIESTYEPAGSGPEGSGEPDDPDPGCVGDRPHALATAASA